MAADLASPEKKGFDEPPAYPQQQVSYVAAQPQPVAFVQQVVVDDQPKDYCYLSLFTAFFCFWPLGLIALLLSFKVRDYWQTGDHDGARQASTYACVLNVIAIILGIVIYIVVIIIVIIYALFVSALNHCTKGDSCYYD